jgi:nucleoside-diphosphate-sugar epimerase
MILITGATGFVGQAVRSALVDCGKSLRAVSRAPQAGYVSVGAMTADTDWAGPLQGVEQVIHLAARVHMLDDTAADPLREFRKVNVDATLNLARQAVLARVRRFIFISSIKVNGEGTEPGQVYRSDDEPHPGDAYGISKLEAEKGLRTLAANTGLEVVIIRPPLVYGPGVKANFASMMKWLHRGVPLPLGAITRNRRSLVAVENLADLIVRCTEHPGAVNQVFLASDGEDLSTSELLRRLGAALGRPPRLVPIPPTLLRMSAALLGKGEVAQRLMGSLQVDSGKARELLGWTPPLTVTMGLTGTARAFLASLPGEQ